MSRQLQPAGGTVGPEELNDDFKGVMESAEALVRATADLGGEKLAALRTRVEQSVKVMQAKMSQAQEAVTIRAKAHAEAADAYVHENPWKAFGIAAGAGVLVGVLLSRRS